MIAMPANGKSGRNFPAAGRTAQNIFFRDPGMPVYVLL